MEATSGLAEWCTGNDSITPKEVPEATTMQGWGGSCVLMRHSNIKGAIACNSTGLPDNKRS